jgi:hypothetical protein
MKTADISLLLCSSDIVYSKSASADISSAGRGSKGVGLERGGSAGYSGSHSFWTVEDVLQLHRSMHPETETETGNTCAANGHSEGRLLQHVVVMDSSETAFSLSHPREGQGQGQGQGKIFEVYGSEATAEGEGEEMRVTCSPHISYLVDVVAAATYSDASSSGEHYDSKSREDSPDEQPSAATSLTVPSPPPSQSLHPQQARIDLSEVLEGRGSIFTLLFTSGSTGEPKAVVSNDCDCAALETVDRIMMIMIRMMMMA